MLSGLDNEEQKLIAEHSEITQEIVGSGALISESASKLNLRRKRCSIASLLREIVWQFQKAREILILSGVFIGVIFDRGS